MNSFIALYDVTIFVWTEACNKLYCYYYYDEVQHRCSCDRSIIKPKKNGGEDCKGDADQTDSCNTDPCPMCKDYNDVIYKPFETINETSCDSWLVIHNERKLNVQRYCVLEQLSKATYINVNYIIKKCSCDCAVWVWKCGARVLLCVRAFPNVCDYACV